MFDAMFSEPRGNVDRLQVIGVACLMIVGVLFVYSSTMVSESAAALPLYSQLWFRQVIWYVLGLGGAFALCLIDYRIFSRWSLIIYGFSIFLLVLVALHVTGVVVTSLKHRENLAYAMLHGRKRPPDGGDIA